jgi:hypothetical protein
LEAECSWWQQHRAAEACVWRSSFSNSDACIWLKSMELIQNTTKSAGGMAQVEELPA